LFEVPGEGARQALCDGGGDGSRSAGVSGCRPIAARPVGFIERTIKAVRRRPAVASLIALVILAILGGAAGVLYQYQETDTALGQASKNAELYRRASEKSEESLKKESAARRSEKAATLKQARNLYTAHMTLVQRAWERADLEYARELLEKHIPEDDKAPDFRGFEWYYFWRLTHAATPKLTGLPGTVRAMAASPDGRRLAIACDNGTPSGAQLVWETTGNGNPVPFRVPRFVSCLAFSPDGRWLAAGTGRAKEPGVVYLLDARTLKVSHSLKGHSCRLFAIAFTPDSQTLISAATEIGDGDGTPWHRYYEIETASSSRGQLRFWSLAKTGDTSVADFGAGGGLALSVSPNGRWLAVGRSDGRTLLVDLPARKVEATLGRHQYPVWAVAVTNDGRVATGGGQWDRAELVLWTRDHPGQKMLLGITSEDLLGKGIRVKEVLPQSPAEKSGLRCDDLIIEVNGTDLVRSDYLKSIFFHIQPGKEIILVVKRGADRITLKVTPRVLKRTGRKSHEPVTLLGHASGIQAAAFTRDQSSLLTVSLDRTLRVWNAQNGLHRAAYRGHTDGVWGLALSKDGRTVFSGGADKAVFAWDLGTPQEYREIVIDSTRSGCVLGASPSDSTFVQLTDVTELQIDADTGKIVRKLARIGWQYTSDGKLVVDAVRDDPSDKLIKLWRFPVDSFRDPSSAERVNREFSELAQRQKPLILSPDRPRKTKAELLFGRSPNGARCLICYCPTILNIDHADDIQVWNLRKATREPVAIKLRPRKCDFSPSGRYLYAFYWDGPFHVWDLDAGRAVLQESYLSPVSGADFSPSERYVAAATHDGLIRIWKTDGMRLIHTLRTRADATWGFRFSWDERTFLAANWDGRIRLWDLETGEERLTLGGPSGAATNVAITPDGRTVIGAYDGMAVLWHAAKDGEAPRYRTKK
jgi:WD40 repeat protein